jgi:cell division septation protein DedD
MQSDLLALVATSLGVSAEEAGELVETYVFGLKARLERDGYVEIAGLGTLMDRGHVLFFEPEPSLAETVNISFSGLESVLVEDELIDTGWKRQEVFGAGSEQELTPDSAEEEQITTGEATETAPAVPDSADELTDDEIDFEVSDDIREFQAESIDVDSEYDVESDDAEVADVDRVEDDEWTEAAEPSDHHLGAGPPPEFEEADFELMAARPDNGVSDADFHQNEDIPFTISDRLDSEEPQPSPLKPVVVAPIEGSSDHRSSSRNRGYSAGDGSVKRTSGARIGVLIALVVLVGIALAWYFGSPTSPALEPTDSEALAQMQEAPPITEAESDFPLEPEDTATIAGTEPPAAVADASPVPAPQPPVQDDPMRGQRPVVPEDGGYTLIVGGARSRDAAEAIATRYRAQGYRVGILTGSADGRPIYRVGVGQFASHGDAAAVHSNPPENIPRDAWVLRVRPAN